MSTDEVNRSGVVEYQKIGPHAATGAQISHHVVSLAGVPGLEPRLTEPESVGLPITPYPMGTREKYTRGNHHPTPAQMPPVLSRAGHA